MFKKYFLILCTILSAGSLSVGAAEAMEVDGVENVTFYLKRQVGVRLDGSPKWEKEGGAVKFSGDMTFGDLRKKLQGERPGVRVSRWKSLEDEKIYEGVKDDVTLERMNKTIPHPLVLFLHTPAA